MNPALATVGSALAIPVSDLFPCQLVRTRNTCVLPCGSLGDEAGVIAGDRQLSAGSAGVGEGETAAWGCRSTRWLPVITLRHDVRSGAT